MPEPKSDLNTDGVPIKNLVLAKTINVGGDLILTSPNDSPQNLLTNRVKRNLPPLLSYFVGRENTLDEIARYFEDSLGPGVISIWVINGQGGIGKTTLAWHYAWIHDIDYPGGIFMVDCSTEDFAIGMANLFPLIFSDDGFLYDELPKSARLVADYLSSSTERFLLILDNVGSVEHWHRLLDSGYLPTGSYDCLITTTTPDIPSLRSRLLERLTTAEGTNLLTAFRDDIHSDENRTTVESLVEWFGGVPFYLSVLGMYMKRHRRLSWQSYAASLDKQGLTAVRATEDAAGTLPDRYARRIDEVLDNLLNSLEENERRTLEYAVLLFPGEINGYALLNILTYDDNMHFPPMPGYAFPARHVLDSLEDDQILTARGEGNHKVFSIHQILRSKLIERISADQGYKTTLLRQVYKAAVERICSSDQLISCDDSVPTWPPLGVYYHSMQNIFQALEKCGFIPTDLRLYDHWIAFSDRMGTARRLASKHGGRVEIQMIPLSATHVRQLPVVVVEQADYAQAHAFRSMHRGEVEEIHDPSKNTTSFYVIIPINS
jgi:NB-ARC domain